MAPRTDNTFIWHIQEGFSLQKHGSSADSFSLNCGNASIIFHADDIDGLIYALERAKSQIQIDQQKAREEEALARWGKARRRVGEARPCECVNCSEWVGRTTWEDNGLLCNDCLDREVNVKQKSGDLDWEFWE